MNCLSLTKNIDEIREIINSANIDIMTLSETHLSQHIHDSEIEIDSYDIIRRDRNLFGGGTAIYIRESINYQVRKDLCDENLEIITIEINIQNVKPFIIVVWYRPPSANVQMFDLFETVLQKIDNLHLNFVVLGDLNCNMLANQLSWQSRHLLEITDTLSLSEVINSPTRVTVNTSTLVDVIFVNDTSKVRKSLVIPVSLSDHYMICCIWGKEKLFNENVHKYKNSRNVRKVNIEQYKEDIGALQWESVYRAENANNAYSCFEKDLLKEIDKHAMLRRKRIKKKESPWINDDIVQLIRDRNKLKQKAKRSQTLDDWNEYKRARNKVTAEIRKAKREYIQSIIQTSNGQSGDIWKSLNYVMPKKNKSDKILEIERDGIRYTEKRAIVDNFNDYFVNIGKQLQSDAGLINDDTLIQEEYYPCHANLTSFRSIEEDDVLKVIKSMSDKKACGNDNIPMSLIKPIAHIIVKPITHIFNLSIQQGLVPTGLKISRVTPIFKGGNKNEIGNYRPISVLPVFAKILEKIISRQLYDYVTSNSLLSNHQSGFRPKHSTMTALLNVTESWLDSLDRGNFVGIIALDLRKAFDTVDHDVLLLKLKRMGIDGNALKWIQDYLLDRHQYTILDGVQSTMCEVKCGVPQGSNLGPLLFVMYINDLAECLDLCQVSLYADDTCIYVENKNVDLVVNTLNKELTVVSKWLKNNRLVLNTAKCEFVLLGSRKRLKNVHPQNVSIESNVIHRVTHLKYLGIMIDECLNWNIQVEKIIKDITSSIYLLKRIRPYITQNSAMLFYKSIIQAKFDYCDVIWGNCGKGSLNRLQKLQNRALRIVLNVEWMYSTVTL